MQVCKHRNFIFNCRKFKIQLFAGHVGVDQIDGTSSEFSEVVAKTDEVKEFLR